MKSTRNQLTSERGVALIGMVIGFTAFLALTAVAIDIAHLAFTATEVQNAAEVAATAGARGIRGDSAQADAVTAITKNTIAGQAAGPENLISLEVGYYDEGTGTFTAGGIPPNAARATVTATVQNLIAGGPFSDPNSTVVKRATAAFTPVGKAPPDLPLAFGDCNGFRDDCFDDNCMPTMYNVPAGTSAWTSFDTGRANASAVRTFLPMECGGAGVSPPTLTIGNRISLNNALSQEQQQALLSAVQCTVSLGKSKFVVPVVSCNGHFRESSVVVGFASLIIDSVTPAGIDLHTVVSEDLPGPPGDGNFGTGYVVLVG